MPPTRPQPRRARHLPAAPAGGLARMLLVLLALALGSGLSGCGQEGDTGPSPAAPRGGAGGSTDGGEAKVPPALPPGPARPTGKAPEPGLATDHLKVGLAAEHLSVAPGNSVLAGIHLKVEEHWHVYWKNPGIGDPVAVTWNLPDGWTAGPILWPTPNTFSLGGIVTYGFDGHLVLPVELRAPADAPAGKVELQGSISWLVCHEECVPGDAEVTLTLEVAPGKPEWSPHAPLFTAARESWPKPLPAGARVAGRMDGKQIVLELTGDGPWREQATHLYLYPEKEGEGGAATDVVDTEAAQDVLRGGDQVTMRLRMPKRRRAPPEALKGVLVVEAATSRKGFAVEVALGGAAAASAAGGASAAPASAGATPQAAEAVPAGFEKGPVKGEYALAVLPTVLTSSDLVVDAMAGRFTGGVEEEQSPLWLLLLGALVGGIVLNVMPCVLPVLSIKVLGFVSQADEHPAKARRHAYAFALGVLASFWFLAGLVLSLRAGGEQLGWGFHFQSPIFVASMAALMFGVAMNLAGVFEFGMSVQTLAGDAASKIHVGGYASSFWSGALATVIATPCTAPMMGPAVGYAMTAPMLDCLAVFTFLGVGMALPYVLLSMSPRLLKKMPRPGPWMETFKHALAFPMFATVIWLGFVLSDHVGAQGVLWMFLALLVLGLALWIYGTWGTPSTSLRTRLLVGYCLAFVVAMGAFTLMRRALDQAPPEAPAAEQEGGIAWEPWSPERVAWRLSQGKTVFVDFTAKWCVSCLAQERAFIDTEPVRKAIAEHGVVMLKADWTRRDKHITAGLAEHGRSSVPLYLVYRPAKPAGGSPGAAGTGAPAR
ncbi:MAG: protein-disulfide reductase DsbD family protein [Planctomycetia bacterium]